MYFCRLLTPMGRWGRLSDYRNPTRIASEKQKLFTMWAASTRAASSNNVTDTKALRQLKVEYFSLWRVDRVTMGGLKSSIYHPKSTKKVQNKLTDSTVHFQCSCKTLNNATINSLHFETTSHKVYKKLVYKHKFRLKWCTDCKSLRYDRILSYRNRGHGHPRTGTARGQVRLRLKFRLKISLSDC